MAGGGSWERSLILGAWELACHSFPNLVLSACRSSVGSATMEPNLLSVLVGLQAAGSLAAGWALLAP
eukprot:5924742-Pyramimonas_sp.AAC.1